MSRLVRTTLYELATLADELELDDNIVFTTEDPQELEYYEGFMLPFLYRNEKITLSASFITALSIMSKCFLVTNVISSFLGMYPNYLT